MKKDIDNIISTTVNKMVELDNKKILEVGCGSGFITEMLISDNNTVLAIDNDEESLKKVPSSISDLSNVQIEQLAFDEVSDRFDLIVFSLSLHHMEDPLATLNKAKKLLNDGGHLLIIEPDISIVDVDLRDITNVVDCFDKSEKGRLIKSKESIEFLNNKYNLKSIKIRAKWITDDLDELVSVFYEEDYNIDKQTGTDSVIKLLNINDYNDEIVLHDNLTLYLV